MILRKRLYFKYTQILQIPLAIPQTSVALERMFSSEKRIKTRLRSRMRTIRLSALSLHSIVKKLGKTLDEEAILQHFKILKDDVYSSLVVQ